MNRYALSPIPPLATPGSDNAGGQPYRTSWVIEAPYAGFYGLKGTVDNGGRILVDGVERMSGGLNYPRRGLEGFKSKFPQTVKFPLSEGKHTIEVEVVNQITDTFEKVNKKIFDTRDWATPAKTKTSEASVDIVYVELNSANKKIRVKNNGKRIELKDGDGNDTNVSFEIVAGNATFSNDGRKIIGSGEVTINLKYDDNPNYAGEAVRKIKIGGVTWNKRKTHKGQEKKSVTIGTLVSTGLESGSVKDGVSYSGPSISSYIKGMISPTIQDINLNPNEEIQGKQWVMRWDNVDFPISGQYKIRTQVDDEVDVLIDGVKVQTAKIRPPARRSDPIRYETFNATAGKKSIELRLRNIRIPNTGFQQNPTAVKMDIVVPVDVSTGLSRPWIDNPVGISAILIPPPCPKEVTGKGKICRIVVDDPGNGFPKPPTGGTGDGEYPVTLELDGIEVINPGINHNCGVDQVVIEPSNGAQLSYQCDTFGRITNVNIVGSSTKRIYNNSRH